MSHLNIRCERPDQPEVVTLLADLDRYLASLYPPEANFILDVQALLAPDVSFFVARDGQQAVGTGAFRLMQGEAATGGVAYGEIKRMYVDPARRGERIGVQLLAVMEERLRALGCKLALLETGPEQTAAVRLYENCGYTQRPVFGLYPDNGLSVYYSKVL
ncbi:MAG: GNAT family N-acetyltransferase [Rubrivivax sp.]|nr:GNAT family N-acetyltransferase [Rubrivivax sp.]